MGNPMESNTLLASTPSRAMFNAPLYTCPSGTGQKLLAHCHSSRNLKLKHDYYGGSWFSQAGTYGHDEMWWEWGDDFKVWSRWLQRGHKASRKFAEFVPEEDIPCVGMCLGKPLTWMVVLDAWLTLFQNKLTLLKWSSWTWRNII